MALPTMRAPALRPLAHDPLERNPFTTVCQCGSRTSPGAVSKGQHPRANRGVESVLAISLESSQDCASMLPMLIQYPYPAGRHSRSPSRINPSAPLAHRANFAQATPIIACHENNRARSYLNGVRGGAARIAISIDFPQPQSKHDVSTQKLGVFGCGKYKPLSQQATERKHVRHPPVHHQAHGVDTSDIRSPRCILRDLL